jgi:predicted protein tyrosine phosphatase
VIVPFFSFWPNASISPTTTSPLACWVASIREQDADPIPRPEFFGNRINLAFYDLTDGPNIATAAHVEKVYRFSQRWAKAAHSDPTTASLVVHCFAGISRSSAIAMIPLLLYYRSEKAAAKRLYEINRWAAPNTHVLYLIEEKFHLRGSLCCAIKAAEQGYREDKSYERQSDFVSSSNDSGTAAVLRHVIIRPNS